MKNEKREAGSFFSAPRFSIYFRFLGNHVGDFFGLCLNSVWIIRPKSVRIEEKDLAFFTASSDAQTGLS